jgi:urea transporter
MLATRIARYSSSWDQRAIKFLARGFSTGSPDKKDTPDDSKRWAAVQEFSETSATGVGQVIFLNSHVSGGVIMGGLALADPYLATLAALGTVTATATAKGVGLDSGALKDGLWGYNGCLVGCAAAVFGPASILGATTFTVLGSAASPLVTASLKETMDIPQWTFAFNAVTLSSLLRTRPLLPTPSDTSDAVSAATYSFGDYALAPLTGISQIFVVESALSGGVILGGISMYSQGLAAHALAGSAIGTLAGAFLAADSTEIAMGLWGFNSALTSMAVGTFFVHSTAAMALSAGGAGATAILFGAMKTVFGAYGAPCLTLPFCFTMSACYVLHRQIPGLVLAKSPHSPEKNS